MCEHCPDLEDKSNVLSVVSVEDKFVAALSPLLTKPMGEIKRAWHTLFDDNGTALYCSYLGAIYEDTAEDVAISDFTKKVAEVYNKYTVVAQLTPALRMELCDMPDRGKRYMLLNYVFIREFPKGALSHLKSDIVFDATCAVLPEAIKI